jgi:hypothetical protein
LKAVIGLWFTSGSKVVESCEQQHGCTDVFLVACGGKIHRQYTMLQFLHIYLLLGLTHPTVTFPLSIIMFCVAIEPGLRLCYRLYV